MPGIPWQSVLRNNKKQEVIAYIKARLKDVQRVDIIWDQYRKDSLKTDERISHGVGSRRMVSSTKELGRVLAQFRQQGRVVHLFV